MIQILVTGAGGQLGMEIEGLVKKYPNFDFYFRRKDELDITNYQAVETFVNDQDISVILNCAAYTNVDQAEKEEVKATEINSLGVKNLALAAKKFNIKLVHFSTDYVFEGTSSIPYKEDQTTNPQNVYGKSKLAGEKELLSINPDNSLIVRTSWLYSSYKKNFVKTILQLCENRKEISVVNDQTGAPTYAIDLAKAMLDNVQSIQHKGVSIVHYSNKGSCSWYEFAKEIVLNSNLNCTIIPVSSEYFPTIATRPRYSLLDTSKIEELFHLEIPHWKDSLKKCLLKVNSL